MTRVTTPHHTHAQYDQDLIASLTYERDQAVAALEKIARMHNGKRMKTLAKERLRDIESGQTTQVGQ